METTLRVANPFIQIPKDSPSNIANSNHAAARIQMLSILHARLFIFYTFLQCASAMPGGLQDTHKYQWLLLQVSPAATGAPQDIFLSCMNRFSGDSSNFVLLNQTLLDKINKILQNQRLYIAMDEVQELLRMTDYFRSEDGESPRPILRPFYLALRSLFVTVILSGTGLSMTKMKEALSSVVSKEGRNFIIMTDTGCFDGMDEQEKYTDYYIPAERPRTASITALQSRLEYWLRGR
jgi:hypothetical protein